MNLYAGLLAPANGNFVRQLRRSYVPSQTLRGRRSGYERRTSEYVFSTIESTELYAALAQRHGGVVSLFTNASRQSKIYFSCNVKKI